MGPDQLRQRTIAITSSTASYGVGRCGGQAPGVEVGREVKQDRQVGSVPVVLEDLRPAHRAGLPWLVVGIDPPPPRRRAIRRHRRTGDVLSAGFTSCSVWVVYSGQATSGDG